MDSVTCIEPDEFRDDEDEIEAFFMDVADRAFAPTPLPDWLTPREKALIEVAGKTIHDRLTQGVNDLIRFGVRV